jgi:short-subunit dehydrogenase
MDLRDQRILITGAGGGIGRALAAELARCGARLALLDRSPDALAGAMQALDTQPAPPLGIACDITLAEQRDSALRTIERDWGGLDVLVNLAGVLDFQPAHVQDPGMITRTLQVNLEAPLLLVRAVLPGMMERGHGRIVNVGSMFGSIGFPCFAAYSATKFALRGYSQALRRELAGTGVGVTYVSPRAVRTPLNPPAVHAMAARGMLHMDEPERVARTIARAMQRERNEAYVGFPEGLIARLNALLPGLVDRGLARQVPDLLAIAGGERHG